MWWARARCALCAWVVIAGVGCAERATQLVVVVDSDLRPGSELASIDVSAAIAGSLDPIADHRFDLAAGELALPLTFGVAAPGGRRDAGVVVTVIGRDAEGVSIVEWRASTRFRPGHALRLDAPLARACALDERCDENDLVCERGECRDAHVEPATLASVDPDAPAPRLFEGPSAPVDAGAAAGDACVEGAPCGESRCAPGTLRCADGACVPGPPLAAGTECGDGRVCDAEGRCGPG